MENTRAFNPVAIVGVFFLAAVVVGSVIVAGVLYSNSGDNREDFQGSWVAEGDLADFEADISEGSISIEVDFEGTSGLYWAGDFPVPSEGAENGEEIQSAGYAQALQGQMFASGAEAKTFTYADGKLVFEFTIMGATERIELEEE